jgi:hypothetical protein
VANLAFPDTQVSNLVSELNAGSSLIQTNLVSDLSSMQIKAGLKFILVRIKSKLDDLKDKIKEKYDD